MQQTVNSGCMDPDSPALVGRNVKGLLDRLTMEKFDPISDQIIAWANKDGKTLSQVTRLVFEHAIDDIPSSEVGARLCRKMMEQISPKVQDDGIKNTKGTPIAGGQLFRKYLLNRCQDEFERRWVTKETNAAAAPSSKAANGKPTEGGAEEEVALYSEEYYAAQKARRQGLALVKFIGELFKLTMLTERIMHECIKKLLVNVKNPEEEEIESLCKLLTTVGAILDNNKARGHMDVYISRMKELTKSPNVSSRLQFMVQDVIELRERRWISRQQVAAPAMIAQIHEAAAKEKAAQDKEAYARQMNISRGGSQRPEGPPKAGDLSNWGKFSTRGAAAPQTFGPSSVSVGKKETKSDSACLSGTNSNSQNVNKLQLLPRSKAAEETIPAAASSEVLENEMAGGMQTEDDAVKKISEDMKEFFAIRNLDEAEVYFTHIAPQHRSLLVEKFVSTALESKEADAVLVKDFFARAAVGCACSSASFEEGFVRVAEILDDIVIDAPKAFNLMATMLEGSGLDSQGRGRVAGKLEDPAKLFGHHERRWMESLEVKQKQSAEREEIGKERALLESLKRRETEKVNFSPLNKSGALAGVSPSESISPRRDLLDLSNTYPSVLAIARNIDNLDNISYPSGIRRPRVELNVNAKNGKFRYDRDFLLQFMKICTDRPDNLLPLAAIGLRVPGEPFSFSRSGSGRRQVSEDGLEDMYQRSVGVVSNHHEIRDELLAVCQATQCVHGPEAAELKERMERLERRSDEVARQLRELQIHADHDSPSALERGGPCGALVDVTLFRKCG